MLDRCKPELGRRVEISMKFRGLRLCAKECLAGVAALMVEQPLLAPQASSIAGKRPVGADHAMAGQDNGAAVEPVGVGDSAYGAGPADACGHLLVGARNA